MANEFDLLTQAPTLGATPATNISGGGVPWGQLLANQRQFSPQDFFTAVAQFMAQQAGGPRRTMGGFLQAPLESQQVAEENAAWRAKFPEDRRAQAIEKEQAAFGGRLPTFTQQETAARSRTPQERISAAMGGGWENLSPTQRRAVLQSRVGQTPDYVNPMTGVGPTSPQVTAGGPSTIGGMPAQTAIAQATRGAERATRGAERVQGRQQEARLAEWRRRNPEMHKAITQSVLRGEKEPKRPARKEVFAMFR